MDAVLRLLRLLDTPADAAVLAPLAVREIYYRVLTGELGARLRALTMVDSHSHRDRTRDRLLMRHYDRADAHRCAGRGRTHERIEPASPLQGR